MNRTGQTTPAERTAMSRIFFALPLPESARDHLHRWIEAHKPELPLARWSHPLDYHITLKFIGDVPSHEAATIQTHPLFQNVTASSFSLQLDRLGTFGKPAAPSVLWCGVSGELPALTRLQAEVEAACQHLGYPAEDRPYRPHITVARQYWGNGPFRMPQGDFPGAFYDEPFQADRFILYRTNTGASPRYEPIAEYRLS